MDLTVVVRVAITTSYCIMTVLRVMGGERMSLLTELRCFLNEEQMNKVCRIGQSMANEKGVVSIGDVVLTIFLKGLEQWKE